MDGSPPSPSSPAVPGTAGPGWGVAAGGPGGLRLLPALATARRIGAFALITLATLVQKRGVAGRVIHPLIARQLVRAGIRPLWIVCLLGVALGLVIVSQTLELLVQVGQVKLTGPLLVTVVVREIGPLATALVVLSRVGTAMVTELGMARATGEVEALEALGIDPIHYLVVPRVLGVTAGVFALAVYLILTALASGYAFAFLRGLPLRPGEYFGLVAESLSWVDFPLLGLKTLAFGLLNSMIICYQGLAQPVRLDEVGGATARTVAQCFVAVIALDALFIGVYFLL